MHPRLVCLIIAGVFPVAHVSGNEESPGVVLHGNGFVPGHPADHALGPDGGVLSPATATLRVGSSRNAPAGARSTVLVFPMPVLPPGTAVTAARLSVTATATGGPSFSAELRGLGFGNEPAPVPLPAAAGVMLDPTFLTPALNRPQRVTTAADAATAAWLATFYQKNPGYHGGSHVFLQLAPAASPGDGDSGYNIHSADHERRIERPVLYFILDGNEPKQRPNLIVMVTDDQRWDASGHMQEILASEGKTARFPWLAGHTPGMDRLASEGVLFRNAFVTLSLCSPGRTCMLTGKYPHIVGITDNLTHFPIDSVTYATLLRDAGYATGYFGKWHHDDQAERPGFDTTGTFINQGNFAGALSNRANRFLVNGRSVNRAEWVEDVSTGYLLDFIDAQSAAGRPFIAFLGFKTPHSGEPFASAGQGGTGGSARVPRNAAQNALFDKVAPVPAPSRDHRPPFRPDANSGGSVADARNYMETLVGVDDNIARILERLDTLGIARHTAVIHTSDNGYFLGEHGLGDKRAAYEESLRIPFILRYPAIQSAPARRNEMILNLDLAQTLLDFAGVPAPDDMQGRSLKPLVAGKPAGTPAWRSGFFYAYHRDPAYPDAVPTITALRRDDGMKIVDYPVNRAWTEVFDTAADPHEIHNLAPLSDHQDLQQSLREQMKRAAAEVGYPYD
jgi:arylsulfatase A-like enzyme